MFISKYEQVNIVRVEAFNTVSKIKNGGGFGCVYIDFRYSAITKLMRSYWSYNLVSLCVYN